MSDCLIRQIEAAPNVDVRYRCEVGGGGGSGHLEQRLLRNRDSGETELVPAAGLFGLIGAQPLTSWPTLGDGPVRRAGEARIA